MRLLLAEDEKDLSKALCAILKHNNYSVDAVYDGQDALDYGMDENYDGIILDLMMPKKNGLEVLEELRKAGERPLRRALCRRGAAQGRGGHAGFDSHGQGGNRRQDPRPRQGRRRLSDQALFHRRAARAHPGDDAAQNGVYAESFDAGQSVAQPRNV